MVSWVYLNPSFSTKWKTLELRTRIACKHPKFISGGLLFLIHFFLHLWSPEGRFVPSLGLIYILEALCGTFQHVCSINPCKVFSHSDQNFSISHQPVLQALNNVFVWADRTNIQILTLILLLTFYLSLLILDSPLSISVLYLSGMKEKRPRVLRAALLVAFHRPKCDPCG